MYHGALEDFHVGRETSDSYAPRFQQKRPRSPMEIYVEKD